MLSVQSTALAASCSNGNECAKHLPALASLQYLSTSHAMIMTCQWPWGTLQSVCPAVEFSLNYLPMLACVEAVCVHVRTFLAQCAACLHVALHGDGQWTGQLQVQHVYLLVAPKDCTRFTTVVKFLLSYMAIKLARLWCSPCISHRLLRLRRLAHKLSLKMSAATNHLPYVNLVHADLPTDHAHMLHNHMTPPTVRRKRIIYHQLAEHLEHGM